MSICALSFMIFGLSAFAVSIVYTIINEVKRAKRKKK